jgi:hypothetical protein
MKIKDKEIKFRTEIGFTGSIAEFEKMITTLKEQTIEIGVQWPPDKTLGCWIVEPQRLLVAEVIETITKGMPRFKLVKSIKGGIRNPHLHIGDEVVLLGREQFRKLAGQVALKLAGDLATVADHAETVSAIRNLAQKR